MICIYIHPIANIADLYTKRPETQGASIRAKESLGSWKSEDAQTRVPQVVYTQCREYILLLYITPIIYTHERVAVLPIQRRSTSSSGKSDNVHTHAYPIPNGMPAGKKGIRKCSLNKNLMICAHHSNQE